MVLMAACSQSTTTSNTNATTNSANNCDKDKPIILFYREGQPYSYDESTASKIELSGSSANVSGDGVTVSESTVTITNLEPM